MERSHKVRGALDSQHHQFNFPSPPEDPQTSAMNDSAAVVEWHNIFCGILHLDD